MTMSSMQQGLSRRIRPPTLVDPPPVAGRVPPHDLDAEAAVLSAILLDRDALDRVLEILKPEHFYSEANARIFQAAQALAVAMTPIDMVSVASWLRDREWLQKMGGTAYLAQLADATPAVGHVGAHAKVVHEKWRLRQLISTCQRVSAEGYGDVGEVQQFIDVAEHRGMAAIGEPGGEMRGQRGLAAATLAIDDGNDGHGRRVLGAMRQDGGVYRIRSSPAVKALAREPPDSQYFFALRAQSSSSSSSSSSSLLTLTFCATSTPSISLPSTSTRWPASVATVTFLK